MFPTPFEIAQWFAALGGALLGTFLAVDFLVYHVRNAGVAE